MHKGQSKSWIGLYGFIVIRYAAMPFYGYALLIGLFCLLTCMKSIMRYLAQLNT